VSWATAPGVSAATALPSREAIYLTGRLDDLAPGGTGGGGSVHWLRPTGDRLGFDLALSAFSIAGSRWAAGTVGAWWTPQPRTALYAAAELGHGSREGAGFPYRILRVGLSREVAPRWLSLEAEAQHVHVDEVRGAILKSGLAVRHSSGISVRLALFTSMGGNLDARYVSARVDHASGLLAGVVRGRTRPELLGVVTGAPASTSTQLFAGARRTFSGRELTIVLEWIRMQGLDRRAVTVGVRIPRT
jgi:hypothetical protein